MSTHDLSVEVTGGFVLIAIKIPVTTCAVCGAEHKPVVTAARVRSHYVAHVPLSYVFTSPCMDGWNLVHNGKEDQERRSAVVCPTCSAEHQVQITAHSDAIEAARAALAAKVKVWP